MPGVPLDVMDKLKSIFKKKKSPGASATAGTATTTPEGASVPKPTTTDSASKPSTSDPTAPPAGAAPVDASPVDKGSAPTPASDPVDAPAGAPQKSEAAAVAST